MIEVTFLIALALLGLLVTIIVLVAKFLQALRKLNHEFDELRIGVSQIPERQKAWGELRSQETKIETMQYVDSVTKYHELELELAAARRETKSAQSLRDSHIERIAQLTEINAKLATKR